MSVTGVGEKFETWAIVEVMGHSRYAGLVSEQQLGGASFVRIDVPELVVREQTLPAFTKLLGSSAIFSITPCDEETARKAASRLAIVPFTTFSAPEFLAKRLSGPSYRQEEGQEDELEEAMDEDEWGL